MKRLILTVMTVWLLTGSWQAAVAQSATAAKPGKVTHAKPAEPTPAVEAAAAPAALADTTPAVESATTDTAHHHKHGLFGKAKGIMSNEVVKTVAKTAACTMVPGGQAIAGAIDAASSKSAGGAATGAVGAATGMSCIPGMGGAGMGGMAGAGMAGAGIAGAGMHGGAGLAGLATSGVASAVMGQMVSGAAGSQPGMGAPEMSAPGMGDPKPMADCLGMSVEEYVAMTNPTGGQARAATKAETKRSEQLSKKAGSHRVAECNQQVGAQQQNSQMARMQQVMAQAQAQGQGGMSGANGLAAPGVPANGDASSTERFGPAAACMGITVDEYLDMTNPTRGEMRPPTKDESKRAEKLTKRVGPKRVSTCESEHPQAAQ